jgi:glycosyltransferase involved in cell wall biosynthesis
MEAMASGHALLTTDVGNHREMQKAQLKNYGDTGIMIIERSEEALTEALIELQRDPARVLAMGELNRQEIADRWSWDVWKDGYAEFLRKALQ